LLLAENGFPEGHPFRSVRAMPADVMLPPISGYSAALAAACGMGFAFAHHFADYDAACVMLSYRENFKPSAALARPCVILGTAAIAADTDVQAKRIAASAELHYVRRAQGEYLPLESPEAAAPQAITNGWRAIAPASRPEALIVSRTGCSPWPTQRAPTKLWSLPWCSTMRRAGIPTSYWRKPSRYHNDFPDGREGVELRAIYRPCIGHRSAKDFAM